MNSRSFVLAFFLLSCYAAEITGRVLNIADGDTLSAPVPEFMFDQRLRW